MRSFIFLALLGVFMSNSVLAKCAPSLDFGDFRCPRVKKAGQLAFQAYCPALQSGEKPINPGKFSCAAAAAQQASCEKQPGQR